MVMSFQIKVTKDTATPKLKRLPRRLNNQIKRASQEIKNEIVDRARFYSKEITGPYSVGAKSMKLMSSIQGQVRHGKDKTSISIFQKPSVAPYGVLQEEGVDAGRFQGWRPIRQRGMIRVKNPPFHSGFGGKHFMARAGRDSRQIAREILADRIRIAIGG